MYLCVACGVQPKQFNTLEMQHNKLRRKPDVWVRGCGAVDMSVTQKTFNFPAKKKLPFFFVSASDGTNVVKVFNEAIQLGLRFKSACLLACLLACLPLACAMRHHATRDNIPQGMP